MPDAKRQRVADGYHGTGHDGTEAAAALPAPEPEPTPEALAQLRAALRKIRGHIGKRAKFERAAALFRKLLDDRSVTSHVGGDAFQVCVVLINSLIIICHRLCRMVSAAHGLVAGVRCVLTMWPLCHRVSKYITMFAYKDGRTHVHYVFGHIDIVLMCVRTSLCGVVLTHINMF